MSQSGQPIRTAVSDANANFVLGVDPVKSEPWLKAYLQDFTTQNVSLIKLL